MRPSWKLRLAIALILEHARGDLYLGSPAAYEV